MKLTEKVKNRISWYIFIGVIAFILFVAWFFFEKGMIGLCKKCQSDSRQEQLRKLDARGFSCFDDGRTFFCFE